MMAERTPGAETENREADEGSKSKEHSDDDDNGNGNNGSDSDSDTESVETNSTVIDRGGISQRIWGSRTRRRGTHFPIM